MDEFKLGAADLGLVGWLAVVDEPPDDPGRTEDAGDEESRTPSVADCDPGNNGGRKDRADVRAGVEDSGCERTLALRKPFRRGLDGGGEVAGLAEAEEEARDAEAQCRTSEGMAHGGDAPYAHDDGVADARAEAVDHLPSENEADGVSELKGADDVAILRFCPADAVLQHRCENA